jgi:hypothetical protein
VESSKGSMGRSCPDIMHQARIKPKDLTKIYPPYTQTSPFNFSLVPTCIIFPYKWPPNSSGSPSTFHSSPHLVHCHSLPRSRYLVRHIWPLSSIHLLRTPCLSIRRTIRIHSAPWRPLLLIERRRAMQFWRGIGTAGAPQQGSRKQGKMQSLSFYASVSRFSMEGVKDDGEVKRE